MELKTKRLILRDLKEEDTSILAELINDLDISKFLALVPFPYSIDDAKWFVNKCISDQNQNPRTSYELAITIDNNLVGVVGLTKVDDFNGTATLGYWLAKKVQRQGIMTEAVNELIRFAFIDLNLNRLNVEAFVDNVASNALIKKLGFSFEGIQREGTKCKATGKLNDANQYGLLKSDWIKK